MGARHAAGQGASRDLSYAEDPWREIEKAHPDVFNTLLQILDNGRLTDAQGRTVEEIEHIVDLQIADLARRLAGRRLAIDLTEPARLLIARHGYDPVYGARPLRRYIQREVETRPGRALIEGDILDGATITLDAEDDEHVVRWQNPGVEQEEEPAEEAVHA